MSIRANSEKGFSLIELLIVVAILGVLAAVGVVGYQGYIDSTKRSVTESNAKAVQQWIENTDTVREARIKVNIPECETDNTSQADIVACMNEIAKTSNPFAGFKNAYDSTRRGASMIYATTASTIAVNDACVTHSAELGDVVIHVDSDTDVSVTPYYCVSSDGSYQLGSQTGWTVKWGD